MGERKPSNLDGAVGSLGKVATGFVGQLFGARAVGAPPEQPPSVSPEVDRVITQVGDVVGKVLHAVGEGLERHPTDPVEAARAMGAELRDPAPVPREDGWSGLTAGLGHLAEGVGATVGRVVDELGGRPHARAEAPPAPPREAPPAASPEAPLAVTPPEAPPGGGDGAPS